MRKGIQLQLSLIRYEWLKLRKYKQTYLCLLLLLIIPALGVKIAYDDMILSETYNYSPSSKIVNIESGETLEGFSAMRYIDEKLHTLQGVLEEKNPSTSSTYDYSALGIEDDDLDIEQMESMYGEDWQELLQKSREGTLTALEYHNVLVKLGRSASIPNPENYDKLATIRPYYNALAKLKIETMAAISNTSTLPPIKTRELELLTLENQKLWLAAEAKNALYQGIGLSDEYHQFYESHDRPFMLIQDASQTMLDFLNEQYLDAPEHFDSLIGINFFTLIMENMRVLSPLIFLVLAILFAPLFNQEYTVKTDQILKPTQHGMKIQARAKLSLGFIFILGYAMLSLLIFWLIPLFSIGYHSFDTYFYYQLVHRGGGFSNTYHLTSASITLLLSSLYMLSYFIFFAFIIILSSLSKNTFSFLIKFLLLLGIGSIIMLRGEPWSLLYTLKYYSPFTFFDIHMLFSTPDFYGYAYHEIAGFVVSHTFVLWCIWSILIFIMLYISVHYYHKRTIQNA